MERHETELRYFSELHSWCRRTVTFIEDALRRPDQIDASVSTYHTLLNLSAAMPAPPQEVEQDRTLGENLHHFKNEIHNALGTEADWAQPIRRIDWLSDTTIREHLQNGLNGRLQSLRSHCLELERWCTVAAHRIESNIASEAREWHAWNTYTATTQNFHIDVVNELLRIGFLDLQSLPENLRELAKELQRNQPHLAMGPTNPGKSKNHDVADARQIENAKPKAVAPSATKTISVYVGGDATEATAHAETITSALRELYAASGLSFEIADGPEIASWWATFKIWLKNPGTWQSAAEKAQKAEQAL